MTAGTVKTWLGGAGAAFVGGFIDGMPVGSPVGAGIAVADGQAHANLTLHTLLVEAAHVLAVPVLSGLADVRAYQKENPFPNPFADVQQAAAALESPPAVAAAAAGPAVAAAVAPRPGSSI
jgi:hypothetical protein